MVWTSVTPSYPNRQECMMINTALAHDGEKTEREGKGGREVEKARVGGVTYANAPPPL